MRAWVASPVLLHLLPGCGRGIHRRSSSPPRCGRRRRPPSAGCGRGRRRRSSSTSPAGCGRRRWRWASSTCPRGSGRGRRPRPPAPRLQGPGAGVRRERRRWLPSAAGGVESRRLPRHRPLFVELTPFVKDSADGGCSSAKEITKVSGISCIIPEMEICDFDFDPCGYSMNGICGPAASTIHVTPEEGFSYASYEAMNVNPGSLVYSDVIKRVLSCFCPSDFSVAVTIFGGHGFAKSWAGGAEVGSYMCDDLVEQELPGGGLLKYQSFTAVAPGAMSPRSTLDGWNSDGMETGQEMCIDWEVEKKAAKKGLVA